MKQIGLGGTTIVARQDLDRIPLFVKGGTLLPIADPVESIAPGTCFDVTVNIVGKGAADFTLYEDDGATTAYAAGSQNRIRLHVDHGHDGTARSGGYRGPPRCRITGWQTW